MFTFHQATLDDADAIARIVSSTSGGMAELLLDGLIPGLGSDAILSATFSKGEGPYRTDNVICSRDGERLTSMLFAYPSSEHKVPALLESFIPSKRLNPVRPILEKCAPDSLYINTLWLEESLRGKGHIAALLLEAESICRTLGVSRISVFCWNDADEAMRRWTRHGFTIFELLDRETIPVDGHDKGGSILCRYLEDV